MSLQDFERQGVRAHPGKGKHIERAPDTSEARLARSREFIRRHVDLEDIPAVTERLDRLLLLYDDIHETARHTDVMYYPSGSADIFPILLTDNLVIVDRAFLFNENKPRSSAMRRTIAKANKPVALHQIAAGTYGVEVRDALRVAGREVHVHTIFELNQIIRMGYETFGKDEEQGEDNFAHTIANLGILGVDLSEVTVRKLAGCYRISFPFEGARKNIYYVTEEFPLAYQSTKEQRREKARSVQERIRGYIGKIKRVGVMKKADLISVSDGFIRLDPDVIVMDTLDSVPSDLDSTYEITELSDETRYSPLHRFGYKSQKEPRIDVQVAIRER